MSESVAVAAQSSAEESRNPPEILSKAQKRLVTTIYYTRHASISIVHTKQQRSISNRCSPVDSLAQSRLAGQTGRFTTTAEASLQAVWYLHKSRASIF